MARQLHLIESATLPSAEPLALSVKHQPHKKENDRVQEYIDRTD